MRKVTFKKSVEKNKDESKMMSAEEKSVFQLWTKVNNKQNFEFVRKYSRIIF